MESKHADHAPGPEEECPDCHEEVAAHLRKESIEIEHGPVHKVGARRALRSLYFRDPDGNLIEIANEVDA